MAPEIRPYCERCWLEFMANHDRNLQALDRESPCIICGGVPAYGVQILKDWSPSRSREFRSITEQGDQGTRLTLGGVFASLALACWALLGGWRWCLDNLVLSISVVLFVGWVISEGLVAYSRSWARMRAFVGLPAAPFWRSRRRRGEGSADIGAQV